MPLVLFFLLGLLLVAIFIGLVSGLIGLLVMLLVAGFVGWLADLLVPGQLPYGWLGAIVAGLLGAVIGTLLIGHVGPTVAGIPFVPALLGAVIVAFAANLLLRNTTRRRY
ncbi:MAG: GlsB/YeaQ/YmgE family stress response membrane protein [Chloroflexi bacterium]|nr:GlsB/YeaQ/YmgE family stress response membrane protein [Chloroflexota bacterium]MCL5110253.1 GlsB/YeaQ/YmgE family stress response membrane protein [Chloroflexota bacterium]MCL5110258.1 GlsB/YeaQ/YmgE family stress response membrane protein [Chloroflexota bacterium]